MASGALTAETIALGVLVGRAGSPGGQVARVVIVLAVGAGLLVVERRGGAWSRAVVALVAGLTGLVAGIGIGLMHLVKSDLGIVAISGLVVLAAGLVLFGAAAVRLWRATPGWWRLLGVPLAFLLVEFVLIPFTVAVYATNVPATSLGGATPADRGLFYQDVVVTTADCVRLAGWYVPSTNGAAVVVLHGAGSTRSAVLPHAAVLARHGYGVLLVDARGHGRSGGTAMDLGWWGDRDVTAAVHWLAGRPDVTAGRIGVLGLSMGGEEAIGAAGHDPAIRAVVAEGALWRGSMDAGWLPGGMDGAVRRAMLGIQTAVAGVLTDAPQPVSLRRALAAAAPRPVLLIAGKPELRGDRYLRDHAPGNVQLWELADTPHISGLSHHPQQWERRVIGFLDGALLAG